MKLIIDPNEEKERVQLRYSRFISHYPKTIAALRKNPAFLCSATRLVKEKRLKEWHLTLVVANLIFNYCNPDRTDLEAMLAKRNKNLLGLYPEGDEPIRIPDTWLTYKQLENTYFVALHACVSALGAHPKPHRFKPVLLEKLLRYRGVFFEVDIEHEAIFPEIFE